jgi:dienelactone hydrolase
MRWSGDARIKHGVRERRFEVECEGRLVPGLAWEPEAPGAARPLALIGHGGSNHKGSDYVRTLARRLARQHGIASAAIDGPVHGDRSSVDVDDADLVRAAFRKDWERPEVTDEMVADWRAALDAMLGADGIATGPVGYWGLSMGTIFGLPLVAAEPRIEVAALGAMGVTGPSAKRLERDAARVRCPVLFLVQWDDELVPRESALALFDALGAKDKRLHAHPGPHAGIPAEEFLASQDFLARFLLARRNHS